MEAMSTQEQILLAAMELIQTQGYNAFSYKDLSRIVQIKTSSIHYYYPKKEDLAVAVIRFHLELLTCELNKIKQNGRLSTEDKLLAMVESIVEFTYNDQKKMCLGGMFASDLLSLPEAVQQETQLFFDCLQGWVEEIVFIEKQNGRILVSLDEVQLFVQSLVAQIEGGLLLSRLYGDDSYLSTARRVIEHQFALWAKGG